MSRRNYGSRIVLFHTYPDLASGDRNPGGGPLISSFVFHVCLDAIATNRTKGSLFIAFIPGAYMPCLVLPRIDVQVISLHFSFPARWRANSDLKLEFLNDLY